MSDAKSGAQAPRWEIPALDGSSGPGYLTASRLESLQQEAWNEAYAEGKAEGIAAGREAVAGQVARLEALIEAQTRPLDALDDVVEKQLVDLAMRVVRQLFRRELKADPGHVIGVVREAVGLLPVAARDIKVQLNPDDAALIRESLASAEGERAWSLVEDPLIERGGCRVTTDTSQIDATNAARLNAAIAAITGDERHS